MFVPLVVTVLAAIQLIATGTTTYTIDPEASRVVVQVGKTGLFAFGGHRHEVVVPVATGTIVLDRGDPSHSTVGAEVEASSLRVTGSGEPPADVPEVQRTMEGARVLDARQFPRITFTSRRVEVLAGEPAHLHLKVIGDFTLHGVSRPETIDVIVDVGFDRITATGTFVIRQTDFDIAPVTAAGGTVRVANDVSVQLTVVAVRRGLS
jgi:polyisoprenoid-binding protein YceI